MADHPDSAEDERVFRELYDLFIDQTLGSLVPPPLPNAGGAATAQMTNNPPPTPPPSEPDLDQVFNNLAALMEVDADADAADLIYHGFYTALANSLGCPITMPNNWKRILYHAYTGFYSATVLQVPRVHRNTLIAKAVSLAKERCHQSNILWAAEEDQTINIDGVDVRTSMSEDRFRNKLYSMVGAAEWAFHDKALQGTIYLLTSRPGNPALMPHLPGPFGKIFGRNQRSVADWYVTWNETYGYISWHTSSFDDNEFKWFNNPNIRSLLYSALKDEGSAGWFGLQETYETDQGIWTWREPRAQGTAAISMISYVLASVNVSIRADFLQNQRWGQNVACPPRRGAIKEEQSKIYAFLNKIAHQCMPGFNAAHSRRARDAFVELLASLGFAL